jgi:L-threonylcarbamoyladenylate synthase
MKTELLAADCPSSLIRAIEILKAGGLVAFPTDTVYGLGAIAFNGNAVKSIYSVKDRPVEKAIPVLIGAASDLSKVCDDVPEKALKLADRFWPGPLTLVVHKHPDLPAVISSEQTVGVRIPDHPVARSLLQQVGPMAVTSANLSGQPSPCTAEEVFSQLGGRILLILDGGMTPGGMPSTIVDCFSTEIRILREGPISESDIKLNSG